MRETLPASEQHRPGGFSGEAETALAVWAIGGLGGGGGSGSGSGGGGGGGSGGGGGGSSGGGGGGSGSAGSGNDGSRFGGAKWQRKMAPGNSRERGV